MAILQRGDAPLYYNGVMLHWITMDCCTIGLDLGDSHASSHGRCNDRMHF